MFCINLKEFAPLLLSGKQLLTGQSRVCNPDQEKENLVETWCTQSWLRLETAVISLSQHLKNQTILSQSPSPHTHRESLPSKQKVPFLSCREACVLLPANIVRRRTKWGQVVVYNFTQRFLHIMVTLLPCLIQPHLFRVPAACTVYVKFQELVIIPSSVLEGGPCDVGRTCW